MTLGAPHSKFLLLLGSGVFGLWLSAADPMGLWVAGANAQASEDGLPALPEAGTAAPASPANSPASAPSPAQVAPSTPPTTGSAGSEAPVPFRPTVQPTQTQPPIAQPFPQPLSQPLSYSTNDPLKPGDVVSINVLGFANLSGQQQISGNGTIQLPLGGPIFVAGYTPIQVAEPLSQALLPYVRRPQVSVALVNASPLRISVSGEVMRPGPRLLDPTNAENQAQRLPPTLSTALMESGGITPSADLRNIVIRRAVAPTAAGRPVSYGEFRVNLWDAVSRGDLDSDPRIFNGDEIIVPKAEVANIDQRTLLTSTVAPSEITVQVAGEVNRPGQITVSPMVGVSGAVAAAGGLTVDADAEEVLLLRMMPDGRLEELLYSFGEASEPLIAGDVVVVQPSGQGDVGGVFDFIGRILSPFSSFFNLVR